MDGDDREQVYSVNFNQDQGCFIVSTSLGIRVFNTFDFQSTFKRTFVGGVRLAEMLYRTNIIALVGTGENTSYPKDKLILWDDIAHRPFSELNFKHDVLNVKLRKDRVVVVLDKKVYVYNFENLECSNSFVTTSNPKGLVSLSTDENNCVLAVLDEKPGFIKAITFTQDKGEHSEVQINAHNNAIAAMKLSPDGRFLATASEKGTLIRVFDTKSAEKTTEVRRGADSALISDVLIDPTNAFIACASDKGTVHIFNMKQGDENKKSSLSALGGYFNSEWSFGQFKVKDMNCKVALFDDKIFAVSTAGNYYYGNITKDAIKIEKQEELLKEGEEE